MIHYFLPSLSRRQTVLMPQPVSLYSESTDFDWLSSGPPVCILHYILNKHTNLWQSPITFAPTLDCRFPKEPDFGAALPDMPEAEAEVPRTSEPTNYSPIFKLGLFFSVLPFLSSMLPI
jgi:hypothetical protein